MSTALTMNVIAWEFTSFPTSRCFSFEVLYTMYTIQPVLPGCDCGGDISTTPSLCVVLFCRRVPGPGRGSLQTAGRDQILPGGQRQTELHRATASPPE